MTRGDDPERVHALGLLRFLKVVERGRLRAKVEEEGLAAFRRLNLYHTPEVDPRYKTEIRQDVDSVHRALHERGARSTCYAVTHDPELFGRVDLRSALKLLWNQPDPNIHVGLLSCVPGELALWAGEYPDGWAILTRNPVS